METTTVLYYLFICIVHTSTPSYVFHENTHVVFSTTSPGTAPEYFGFSTLLTPDGLYVGAPKATNNMNEQTGAVYICPLKNLDVKLIMCDQLGTRPGGSKLFMPLDLKPDVWFGASMVFLNNDKVVISASRTKTQFDHKNLLLHGASYFLTPRRTRILDPLSEGGRNTHQAFVTDGVRKDYGQVKTHLYYYAQGQVGFSMAASKMNTIILGAPGLLQWTGGIVSYTYNPNVSVPYTNVQPIANPYYTLELAPDDYFGYSVESGTFQEYGEVLYVAGAPRSYMGAGKVFIFKPPTDEHKPLDIRAMVVGPQNGSYFGASLCCTDINNDGLDDLLVGAPTFVESNGLLPYDQGAVFIYITKETKSGFTLEEAGYVTGSTANGARFGTSIADLGDVNGDGFRDIAIGAPWENNGNGAVYVYMGTARGLNKQNVQRLQPTGQASGFGISIAKGLDVDQNNCNDLAVGAYHSNSAYLYRCVPSLPVLAKITVPTAVNLPHNSTRFQAMFCVSSPSIKFRRHIKLNLIGNIIVDPDDNRAMVIEDSRYPITAAPQNDICDLKTIYVNLTADLLKPMLIKFKLEADEMMKDDSTKFMMDAARLSDNSTMETSVLVQLMRDCGADLFCSPWLNMTFEAINNPYIPGTNDTFGIRLEVKNLEEPAYGLKVSIDLPIHPKRIPSDCSFQDLTMTCDLPQPFSRNETIEWNIDLDYNLNVTDDVFLIMSARLSDKFNRNITHEYVKDLVLEVTPEASFSISGKSVPNASIAVLRDNLYAGADVLFRHSFEITNLGPSDWPALSVQIKIPEKTNLSAPIEGCDELDAVYECLWSIPVMVSLPVTIPLVMNLSVEGEFLKENMTYNATTHILIRSKNESVFLNSFEVTTTLILEPASIIWYIIVPCIFIGLLLLAIIVRILHKCGFFLRKKHEMVQREKENKLLKETDHPSPSETDTDTENNEINEGSNEDLLCDGS